MGDGPEATIDGRWVVTSAKTKTACKIRHAVEIFPSSTWRRTTLHSAGLSSSAAPSPSKRRVIPFALT